MLTDFDPTRFVRRSTSSSTAATPAPSAANNHAAADSERQIPVTAEDFAELLGEQSELRQQMLTLIENAKKQA